MRDYYEILGVDRDADERELKSAYRKAAKKFHPDLHPGDEEAEKMFKELTVAYEVLSDPDKRRMYDTYGEEGVSGNMGGANYADFNDLFGDLFDIFGGGFSRQTRNPNAPMRGADLQELLTISFFEAMNGGEKEVTVRREETCPKCNGEKTTEPSSKHTCENCGGTGQVRRVTQSLLGQMVSQSPCPECDGTGEVVDNPCDECHGKGRVSKNRRIKVKIPKGVDNGNVINLSGQGDMGVNGGPAGDLQIVIQVLEDDFFKRQGSDLLVEVPISYSQAVLGGTIKVPTITGIVDQDIKPGTESGEIIKIKGKGAPILRTERNGDLYVKLNIHVPKNVSKEEEDLLRQLSEHHASDLERKDKSIMDKIKDFFN